MWEGRIKRFSAVLPALLLTACSFGSSLRGNNGNLFCSRCKKKSR
jgi:hypothetical protein